jgi:predicted nucleic acid-binding protein
VSIIIADASPLIALASVDRLELLEKLYQEVCIPVTVKKELRLDSDMRGAKRLSQAVEEGLLKVISTDYPTDSHQQLLQILDQGETEAILLAESFRHTPDYRFLLIDERKGRLVAKQRGLKVAGTGAVLLAAKKHGFIVCIKSELQALQDVGYRLSKLLQQRLLELAGE